MDSIRKKIEIIKSKNKIINSQTRNKQIDNKENKNKSDMKDKMNIIKSLKGKIINNQTRNKQTVIIKNKIVENIIPEVKPIVIEKVQEVKVQNIPIVTEKVQENKKEIKYMELNESDHIIRRMSRPIKSQNIISHLELPDNGRSITLNVPQGIGDIFWIYQKMSPYFDTIHFNILATSTSGKTPARSVEWLPLLQKTGSIRLKVISAKEYTEIISGIHNMNHLLNLYEKGQREFDYSCNYGLEQGIRLEDIDPGFLIETNVKIRMEEYPIPFDNYIVGYVSGGASNPTSAGGMWDTNKWAEFFVKIHGICQLPIVFIGASYDENVINEISLILNKKSIQHISVINNKPHNVCTIIKNSKLFIGYQSGLNIIADNLDVPQFMMYFKMLAPMMYTWCKKENIRTKFNATTFADNPEQAFRQLQNSDLIIHLA